jgi:2-haloacid dehalogenase
MAASPLIVFDVNETLLDLRTMEPTFQRMRALVSCVRPRSRRRQAHASIGEV